MRFVLLFVLLLAGAMGYAQKYKSTESKIYFFSSAPIEDIEATNTEASSVMDLETGNIVFSVPVKQFVFAKSLMKEHFNENYLESKEYPKIVFIGKMSATHFQEEENQVSIIGEMNLHGVKKEIEVEGILVYSKKKITTHAEFLVKLTDYKIKIPKAVFFNIAEEIAITVDFIYEPI